MAETTTGASSRYVLDRDGDLWQSIGNGSWRCLTTESCDVAGQDLVNVCGPLTELVAREQLAAEFETRVEYGHQLPEVGWLFEPRGIKYATHQRTVQYRIAEPVLIDHWTYTDHRHPIEGCTAERHDLTTEAASTALAERIKDRVARRDA